MSHLLVCFATRKPIVMSVQTGLPSICVIGASSEGVTFALASTTVGEVVFGWALAMLGVRKTRPQAVIRQLLITCLQVVFLLI